MTRSLPDEEAARLDALRQLNLLDTPPSEGFDRITRMAGKIFDLPIAAVSLTDQDRQWFKSRIGVDHCSIPREKAPCAEVAEFGEILVIPDLLASPCYASSTLAAQGIRFYAGAPLVTREGHGLGALCVLGTEPRQAADDEIASLTDLAAMVMAQIELQHAIGRIDPASGLPNRVQFLEDLEDLARDWAGERRLAILVDLARAEQVNSGLRVLGASYLDDMIRHGSRMIRSAAGEGQQVYQVAGTQLAFLAPKTAEEANYVRLLQERIAAETTEANARVAASLAIGVVPFSAGQMPPEDILRGAYGAALDARACKSRIGIYSSSIDETHRRRFRLLDDFEAAMAQPDQLRLVVQPRIDVRERRCVGAEALLRWRHPELGDISPAEFIPLVEHSTLGKSVTAWVLDRGVAELGAWQRAGLDLQLSINIFAANLDEEDFAGRVGLCLLRHGVRADLLEIEITESAAVANTGQSVTQLKMLSEAGIQIAIDDFGTGYSSLAYLQSLPANVVKIDQSFVRNIDADGRAAALVSSMITLSRDLGYRVVAEGVETASVFETLEVMDCDEAQGFFFARPMEVTSFSDWLRCEKAGLLRAA